MIGFYDSGIGGLNYVSEFHKISQLPMVYYHPFDFTPLGNQSADFILQSSINGVNTLFSKGCTLVVVACNTASIRSIRYIQQVYLPSLNLITKKNVLGISIPLLEYCDRHIPKNRSILVFGTHSTINSNFYQQSLIEGGYENVVGIALPELATMIESRTPFPFIKEYISEVVKSSGIGYNDYSDVVLACTHYHSCEWVFCEIFPDSAVHNHIPYCAMRLKEYIERHRY